MVPHPLQLSSGRDVGLRRHEAAVGVLRHADHVRELDPLDGVDVDREVPAVDLDGTDPEKQRVETRHHEPLDVVGIAEIEGLAQDVREAGRDLSALLRAVHRTLTSIRRNHANLRGCITHSALPPVYAPTVPLFL